MISDKTFCDILTYVNNKGWISKEEMSLMFNSWIIRSPETKDIHQLQAYMDEVCEYEDYSHLIKN